MSSLFMVLLVSHCVVRAVGDHGVIYSKEDRRKYHLEHGIPFSTTTEAPPVLLQKLTPGSYKENGQEVSYCEYKGVKFAVGADFKDMDECRWVRCMPDKFLIQRQPEVKYTPEHDDHKRCKWVEAGCRRHWVWAKKPRKKCPVSA